MRLLPEIEYVRDACVRMGSGSAGSLYLSSLSYSMWIHQESEVLDNLGHILLVTLKNDLTLPFQTGHSSKSTGLLLTGLLLKVSILSKNNNNSEQKLTKTNEYQRHQKTNNPQIPKQTQKTKIVRTDKKNGIKKQNTLRIKQKLSKSKKVPKKSNKF